MAGLSKAGLPQRNERVNSTAMSPTFTSAFIRPAFMLLICGTVLFGAVYPVLVGAFAYVIFPHKAHGRLVMVKGQAAGSELVGQNFSSQRYFWSRPSATTPPYNAAAS